MAAWDELFGERQRRVAKEVTGLAEPAPGVTVTFTAGRFAIDGPGAFQSPLSFNKGKSGILLQEVSGGKEVPVALIPIGASMMNRVRAAGALACPESRLALASFSENIEQW